MTWAWLDNAHYTQFTQILVSAVEQLGGGDCGDRHGLVRAAEPEDPSVHEQRRERVRERGGHRGDVRGVRVHL